jgi:hypothetical protein
MKIVYQAIWHTNHACDSLGTFNTKEEAEMVGRNWELEMSGVDPEGAEEYCYEVVESAEYDDDDKLEAEYAEEASYEHFNRYIAGDR